jgi:hypothetical protein
MKESEARGGASCAPPFHIEFTKGKPDRGLTEMKTSLKMKLKFIFKKRSLWKRHNSRP